MKTEAEFLRHEYTWSKQSISGSPGLGVIASSTPKDKIQIREIEKIAASAEADADSGIEVELLNYSEEAGFIKAVSLPVPAGEDQRQNKKVFLYQCRDKACMNPAVYCIPQGSWEEAGQTCLPSLILSENWDTSKNILIKYHLIDMLPELFRAVFRCTFRSGSNLAFLVSWKREDYASYSREIMYAIHSILPEKLRKNAGYASLGCGMNQNNSFYFTDEVPEKDYFDVDNLTYHRDQADENALDEFFYDKLATLFWENENLYHEFILWIEKEISDQDIEPGILKKIQWIFLQFCMEYQIDLPSLRKMMKLFPQLFYRAGDSQTLEEIMQNLMHYYHAVNWRREDYINYLNILAEGMSKKGENTIMEEMNWVLLRLDEEYHPMMKDIICQFRQKYKTIYTRLMTRGIGEKENISGKYFLSNAQSLNAMVKYIGQMDSQAIEEEAKEAWMLRGIEILNENVFATDHFKILTDMASTLHKTEEWKKVLKGFLQQLNSRCEELDDEQLKAACDIEYIYENLSSVREETRLKEEMARRFSSDSGEESEVMDQKMEETREEMIPEKETDKKGPFLSFLIRGIPYGFLTGCILYLLNYGLVIGHWKISMGVGGMWLILMLNYSTERIERKKKDGYRLWQALGLCLVEGYIIQTIAWNFLPVTIRVYFFLLLGFLTVLTQCIHGMFLLKEREKEE